jgi:CRISPR-associated protein Cmr3
MTDDALVTWLVEPIDPLVMGDGRTIGTVGITKSRTLPPPSQLAGAVRSQAGSDANGQWVSSAAEVLPLRVLGPVGVVLNDDNGIVDWWLPKPADAVVMEHDKGEAPGTSRVRRMVPLSLPEGCAWGPDSEPAVGMPKPDRRKPDGKAHRHWSWQHGLRPWLVGSEPDAERFQLEGPVPEVRTHVVVGASETAVDGMLYGVTGQRFSTAHARESDERHPWGSRPLTYTRCALAFRTDATIACPERIRALGGERRLASWRRSDAPWPEIPPEVLASAERGFARLYLATPGAFRGGHRPDPAVLFDGLRGEIVASASGRPEIVSGWDFAARPQRPKLTRRLVPAGSVFFLKLSDDAAANRAWAQRTWLAPVSDDEQSRRDGFGLALLGAWSGEMPTPILEDRL